MVSLASLLRSCCAAAATLKFNSTDAYACKENSRTRAYLSFLLSLSSLSLFSLLSLEVDAAHQRRLGSTATPEAYSSGSGSGSGAVATMQWRPLRKASLQATASLSLSLLACWLMAKICIIYWPLGVHRFFHCTHCSSLITLCLRLTVCLCVPVCARVCPCVPVCVYARSRFTLHKKAFVHLHTSFCVSSFYACPFYTVTVSSCYKFISSVTLRGCLVNRFHLSSVQ